MISAAAADAFVANGADVYAFSDPKIAATDYSDATAKTDSAITPRRWGRFITSVTDSTTVVSVSGDTLSTVLVQRTVSGTFKIKATVNGVDSVISKPFTDASAKQVIFRRVSSSSTKFWKNWIPVATSLVKGATDPAPAQNAIVLTEVDLKSSTDSLTITDPLNYWLRYGWLNVFRGCHAAVPELKFGDAITVTAKVLSQSADTDIVALRSGFGRGAAHYLRAKMTLLSQSGPDANGYYTRVFAKTVSPRYGVGAYHVGVDAITKATLYDDTAPYSVSWWGVPYMMY